MRNTNIRFWLLLLNRTTIAAGVIVLAGILGGAWWTWVFINSRLVPLVEENVQKLIGRPIELGKVESVGLTNLRFGALSVPATNTDADSLTAQAVVVEFNPLQVIFNRTLELDVALVQPEVYIAQDKDGRWVTTEINTDLGDSGQNFIRTELKSLRVENGNLLLSPYSQPSIPRSSVGFAQLNGVANLLDANQRINYNINTQPTNGGTLEISGETAFKTQQTNLKVETSNLLAADISNLVELPINLQAGRLDANLNIVLQPNQKQPAIVGSANINQVTARIANLPRQFVDTTGKLQFQGQNITLENINTRFGNIPVQVQGGINTQTGYNLNAVVKPVDVKNLLNTFNLKVPVPVAGALQANIQVKGTPQQPNLIGKFSTTQSSQIDRVLFQKINGAFQVTPKELILQQLQATPNIGGTISGSGRVGLLGQNQVALNLQADNIAGDALAQSYNVAANNINIGNLSANAQISGTANNLRSEIKIEAPRATYPGRLEVVIPKPGIFQFQNAVFNLASGKVTGSGQLRDNRFNARINTSGIKLSNFAQIPPEFQGILNGEFNLSGNTASLQPNTIQATGQANVNLPRGGTINLNNIRLNNGRWQTGANISQIALNRVAENLPENLQGQLVNANLQLAGTTDSFELAAIEATGQATLNLAQGIVNLRNIRLDDGNWQTVANVNRIPLNQLSPNIPGELVSANLNLSGNTASFQPDTIQATGQATLNLAQGSVNLRDIRLDKGNWQALANISQVQLYRLSDALRGRLNGNVLASGNIASFQPEDIQAIGKVNFSQGLAQLQQPLNAQFLWTGEQLQIQQATAPGLTAAGTVGLNLGTSTPEITDVNLNVRARGYNLENIPFTLPGNIRLAGAANFTGQVTGKLDAINAVGDIGLRNFSVNELAFDPILTGKVNFQSGQGTQLQLTGQQDQIALNIGIDNRPESFFIRRDGAIASGTREGENLLVNVREFPITILQSFLPTNINNFGQIAGNLSANLAVNLTNFNTLGDVAIKQPRIGRITASEFRGRVGFDNNNFTLTRGELRQGENIYLLNGNLPISANRPLDFQVSFNQANIQNLLQGLSIFGLDDLNTGLQLPELGNAADLKTKPVGYTSTDLVTQLRQYNDFVEKLEKQPTAQRPTSRIPALAELNGNLSGQVKVAGTLQTGLNFGFNFVGNNWEWGDYNINQVTANGNFADGIFTLLPLQVELDQGLLAFNGQLSQQQLSGQARIQEFPFDLIKPFTPELPVDVNGNLNALVTLSGTLENPSAIGELNLADGTLNNQPVQSAQLSFGYNNARFNFGSNVLVTGTQPVQITGSIPFSLPFASVQPDNNQINIQANVQNEGLAILNVLTNQVNWVSGQGQVNVAVGGTLDEYIINGIASVQNATFKAQALSEPLTNVTGTLRFNGDTIIVDTIQAEYRRGQLTASGILPIYATENSQSLAATNPLTVSLNNLRANIQELYQGEVSANAVIRGTAFKPQLGGEIRLRDGEISLRQQANTTNNSQNTVISTPLPNTPPTPTPTNNQQTTANTPPPVQFANLELILDNVRVTQQPLLSFVTRGDITLNGTLANPLPEGIIDIQSGQINLFTTQFALARGYAHTATFTPERGFDPFLDVRLIAIVPEARGSRILTSPLSGEIEDVSATNFGTLNTVRVQARVNGLASQLNDNLELTSTPARSESEIVALLGGSYINILTQPDATLGIVSLAGSAVLGDLQGTFNEIGQIVGLSELRIFPTLVTSSRRNNSVLGLSAEAIFDISNNFSASISRVFATDEPFRYNLLYRVNDEVILRGSSNLQDESRATVEYETRF